MKTIFLLLLAALAFAATAQPQKINYQGVAVGANGKPIKNSSVGLRLSILDSLPTGTALYTETQTASTDASGQFSIYLGGGTVTAGTFASLPWANGNDKFLKVEMDSQGGNNYQPMGTTQLVSVPYAMVANAIRGSNGQMYQITVGANGPILTCFPPVTSANAGPDQLALTGTTATLAANSPAAVETGTWSILSGNGGTLSSTSSIGATFTKGSDSAYTLVWTMTGLCGTNRDTVNLLFSTPGGVACGQAVTYAGESYPTVQIGTQCWLAKNLNVGSMISSNVDQTNNASVEKYCYANNLTYCAIYGGLYQWAEAIQYQNGASNSASVSSGFTGNVKGICPTGFHVPSDAEFCTLTRLLDTTVNCTAYGWSGTNAGGKMKSINNLWTSPNVGATNTSGFSALPGGSRDPYGSFFNYENDAFFWTFTESSATTGINRLIHSSDATITRDLFQYKNSGLSVRCVKD